MWPPTGDLACNPGPRPDWELNQWPFGLQASTQSTEPHQPGLIDFFKDFLFLFFKDLFIYLFLEREEGREKEREKHQCVVISMHAPPTQDLARNPGICPDWELNLQPFGLHASTQSTEPHQPGKTS